MKNKDDGFSSSQNTYAEIKRIYLKICLPMQ